jgi:DNA-binding IclR family transcriptional regulator
VIGVRNHTQRVHDALRHTPTGLTIKQLMHRTGASHEYLRSILDQMQRAKVVTRKRDFSQPRLPYVYRLVQQAKPAARLQPSAAHA